MNLIEQLHVIQFFLYEKQSFDLRRVSGVFGPNGTGKTALLDGLQIALLGANEREAAFNARVEGVTRGGRSIKQYLLGQRGNDDPENRVRNSALCYLTLVIRNETTGDLVSAGVCLLAAATLATYKTMGYYIVPGAALTLADHLEDVDGVETPLPWKVFRERVVGFKGATTPLNGDEYLRELVFKLRPSRGRTPVAADLRRSFRNAMQLKQIESVDDAVRRYVIDDGGIDLSRLRACAESFNSLRATIARLQTQLGDARKVKAHYDRASDQQVNHVTWLAAQASFERDSAVNDHESILSSRDRAADSMSQAQVALESVTSRLTLIEREVASLTQRQTNHAAHREQGLAVAALMRAQSGAEQTAREIAALLGAMANILRSASASDFSGISSQELASEAVSLDVFRTKLAEVALDDLLAAVRRGMEMCSTVAEKVQSTLVQLQTQKSDAVDKKAAIEENLKRIASGRRELRPNTLAVQEALANAGINTIPVCDLVTVSDRTWQPAIEAYLGVKNLEALVVRDGEERDAARLYERLPDQPKYYHVKLAPAALAIRRARDPAPGSAAALINGDLAARSFLRNLLGELACVPDVDSARGKFAITPTAMLFTDGVERLQRPVISELKLGRVDQTERRKQLLEELTGLEHRLRQLDAELKAGSDLQRRLHIFADDNVATRLQDSWIKWKDLDREHEALLASSQRAADDDYKAICEAIKRASDEATELRAQQQAHGNSAAIANADLNRLANTLNAAAERVRAKEAALAAAKTREDFNPDRLELFRDDVLGQVESTEAQVSYCAEQASNSFTAHGNALARARQALGEFCSEYQAALEPEMDESWRKAREWVKERIVWIEESELVNYHQQVEFAYNQAVKAFRGDVAAAIADQLSRLHRQQDELNRTLARSPMFSNNERYQFKRTLVPEHRELHDFILAVRGSNGDDLLGTAERVPESFRAILEGTADPKLEDTSPLYDYRRFFNFEVIIYNGDREIDKLSSRLRSGSGGEHKTPLYVIAGASLASAWGKRDGVRDGLGVMLLDEAFEKMDPRNSIAISNYLTDLGLQLVFAAPGDSLGTLTAVMDNYYTLQRFGDVMLVEPVTVEERGRDIMRSDSLQEHPDLIEQEIARLEAEDALKLAAKREDVHASGRT